MKKNDFYYKYLKYKNKYLKKIQKGGEITEQGSKINSEFIEHNKNLLNHALQIFGIDKVAEMINIFNDRYVVNKPIISIGTGHGLLEAYIFNNYRVQFLAIEPTSNPAENIYMASEHFYWNPESNAGNVEEFLSGIKDERETKNRSLLLNWCYPFEEYGNYDYSYIEALEPYSIFSISAGINSQEINRNYSHLSNVLKYLFEKNIKYESLKQFCTEWLKINESNLKRKKKLQDTLIRSYLDNATNFDNEELDSTHILMEKHRQFFSNRPSNYIEKLTICYDMIFYLNKLLLHYVNKFNKLFPKKKIPPQEESLLNTPHLEKKNFSSSAGGERFNKFLYDAKNNIQGSRRYNYKVIKSIVSKINLFIDGILADIYDISFDINILVKEKSSKKQAERKDAEGEEGEEAERKDAKGEEAEAERKDAKGEEAEAERKDAKGVVEEIINNKVITIEYVLYMYLIEINNSLIEKINNIYTIITSSTPPEQKIFSKNFLNYLRVLQEFYDIDHTKVNEVHSRKKDKEQIGHYIFDIGNNNYTSVLGLV